MAVPAASALRGFLRRGGFSLVGGGAFSASCGLTNGDATVTHSANSNILINLVPRTRQTFTHSCTTINGSKLVSHSANSKIVAGLIITPAGGVPAGPTIVENIISSTSFFMSNDATSSSSPTLTFTGDGIPVGTIIETINSSTSFELSKPATIGTGTYVLEFDEMFSLKDAELNTVGGTDLFDRSHPGHGYVQTGTSARYARLNPFEATADMPDGSANHSLSEYDGYSHATVPKGVDLEGTEEPGAFSLEWVNATAPQGFTVANGCNNIIYYKEYTSEPTEVPTDVITDHTATANEPGTSATVSVSGASITWVLAAVKTSWNDTLYSIGGAIRSATEKHDLKSGQAAHGASQILLEVRPVTPTFGTTTQNPASGNCYFGQDVTATVRVTGYGSGTMSLYKSTSSGASWPGSWTLINNSMSSGANTVNFTVTTNQTLYFRAFYNSAGSGTYSSITEDFECTQFCFAAGTLITMYDGTYKPIEEIEIGDMVFTQLGNEEVLEVFSPIHDGILEYTFSDGTKTKNTADHPYYVIDKGWCSNVPTLTNERYGIETNEFVCGDICVTDSDEQLELVKVEEIDSEFQTYTFSVNSKTYYANRILVHSER